MTPATPMKKLAVALLISVICPSVSRAAPDDIEAVPQKAVVRNQFVMDDANFEANVFQPHGNAKQARSVLESRLKLQINEINRVCKLDAGQEQKLKLAGGADIRHLFDDVDVVRKKFQASKHDQNAWNNVWQEINPLQLRMSSGLFGDGSFFQKTLRKTLTDEQRQSYDKVTLERKRFRYRATIESVLINLEGTVPLRHAQHETIAKLLFEESEPPATFGNWDHQVVVYHMSRIPEAKIKSILDERQWTLMKAQFDQNLGMEQFLIQNGVIQKQKELARVDEPVDAIQPENKNPNAVKE